MRAHVLVALAAVAAFACGDDPRRPNAPCDVFATASCIDPARMMADVTALAGAAYAGRRAGTPGNALAVDLIASRFAEAGLARPAGRADYRQPFSFPDWTPTAASLSFGGVDVPLGGGYEIVYDSASGAVPETDVVFVGYGLRIPPFARTEYPSCPYPDTGFDEYADVDVTGKIVVALRGVPGSDPDVLLCPPDPDVCSGVPNPAEPGRCLTRPYYKGFRAWWQGAAGILLVSPSPAAVDELVPFTTVWFESIPTLLVDHDLVAGAIPDLATRATLIDTTFAPQSGATSARAAMTVAGAAANHDVSNVVGVVPGTDPVVRNEVIVVGAHLDHMGKLPLRETYFPGADDNASGTAVLLELARAVAASPTKPKRTIVFAAWNAEELGLYGSCHYADVDPAYPLASTAAAFSVDMVGAGTPGLELWGAVDWPEMVSATNAAAAELGLPWSATVEPHLLASDHACFVGAGVPGFLASTPTIREHPDYHTAGDVASGVSPANLESAAKMIWAGVRELATGELTLR
jgi:hypothetical protein